MLQTCVKSPMSHSCNTVADPRLFTYTSANNICQCGYRCLHVCLCICHHATAYTLASPTPLPFSAASRQCKNATDLLQTPMLHACHTCNTAADSHLLTLCTAHRLNRFHNCRSSLIFNLLA